MIEKNLVNNITVLKVSNQFGTAEIAEQGAHLLSWIPAKEEPVLWMSKKSYFEPGKPIRGGVPVCWPWFGSVKQPAHGFARLEKWDIADVSELENGSTQVVLTLEKSALAEFPFRAQMTITVGRSLELALTVVNLGDKPVETSGALHTYFAVSDVANIRISGLDGAAFEDRRASAKVVKGHVQDGEVSVEEEVDRLYPATTSDLIFSDIGTGRSILVEKLGSASTVVWNPWIAKAAAMPDFGDEEYHQMVCIEAGNIAEDARILKPGIAHTLAQKITVL